MDAGQIGALCAAISLIGVFGLFLVRAVIRAEFDSFRKELREEYATKDQLRLVEARIPQRSRAHGAD